MSGYAFISHSSFDNDFAQKLGKNLEKKRIWVDFWNLDTGNLLPHSIADAINLSKWFILIASKRSMNSNWVKYELNMAIIKWIQESEYRIIVVRIDDCQLLPELKPFLYIDCPGRKNEAIHRVTKAIFDDKSATPLHITERRRRIVDRFKEIGAIERLFHGNIVFIYLWGMYGIGKTSIIERSSFEVFNAPLARFPLTEAHGLLRISLELAARAKLTLPPPDASEENLINMAADSIASLSENGYLVFFDDIENVMEEDGTLRRFLLSIFEQVYREKVLLSPILLSSTQQPDLNKFPMNLQSTSHIIKIDRLDDNDLLFCLENWLKLAQPGQKIPDRESLKGIVHNLFGYPLAAKLAANLIVRHSIGTLLKDISYFKDLRIDIAKQLLGSTRFGLTEVDIECLEALAVADTGLSLSELSIGINRTPEDVKNSIDNLTSRLVVFSEDGRLQIHPIIKDYFWSRIYESGKWKTLAQRLAKEAKKRLPKLDHQSEDFIHYCSKAYRLLAMSGSLVEARKLLYDFREELREVSKRLYYAKKYNISLHYIELWLEVDPGDRDIRFLKARVLTRLGNYTEAEKELNYLENAKYRRYKLDHAWGLLMRDQDQLEVAANFFRKGLYDRPNFIPLLRDLGDVNDRLGDTEGASDILGHAYELAPRDPYIVAKYADILEKRGKIEEALSIIDGAITSFPEEAAYEHRMAILLEKVGKYEKAIHHARRAVMLSPRKLPEAILNLAGLSLKLGILDEAIIMLQKLPRSLTKREKQIHDTIMAGIKIKEGDLEKARALLINYDNLSDPYLAYLSASIEIGDSQRNFAAGRVKIGRDRLFKAQEIIKSALQKYYGNKYLLEIELRIARLEKEFN